MIETTVIKYLNDNLSGGVEAFAEIPENPSSKFVIVQKTGSGRVNHIDSSAFSLQSYGTSKYEAATLNEEVKTIMDGIIELGEVSRSALNSDYDFTDPSTKRYRYQAIYNITHY